MPWNVIVRRSFSWAHYLTNYKGAPEPIHGHTWKVEVYLKADTLDEGDMGFDFLEVQEFLKALLPDYCLLNDVFDFSPSAENVARWVYIKVKEKYPSVSKVIVWEKEDCGAEYFE